MTRFASLGSGSRGNATIVEIGGQLILVDCGFSLRQTEERFARLGKKPADLTALLVTHEHSDHISGVAALTHKYNIPVYGSYGTFKATQNSLYGTVVKAGTSFTVGDVLIHPVVVPHDAREPIQFIFEHSGIRIGVISDLGQITPHVISQYQKCIGLMMESNHDENLLRRGNYPAKLKTRISGKLGHLSNKQAAFFLDSVKNKNLSVVVGHISERNNSADLLNNFFTRFHNDVASLGFATQDEGIDWISVD